MIKIKQKIINNSHVFLKLFKYLIILAAVSAGLKCASPNEPALSEIETVFEPPTITGFYITTLEHPDGTGEVIGTPAYTVKEINVFPNPCDAVTYDQLPRYRVPLLYFNHLPDTTVIIIVKGRSEQESAAARNSFFGTPTVPGWGSIIKKLEKNRAGDFMSWNFRDNKGNNVTSGYYRAYIYGSKVPQNYFLDFALNVKASYLENY